MIPWCIEHWAHSKVIPFHEQGAVPQNISMCFIHGHLNSFANSEGPKPHSVITSCRASLDNPTCSRWNVSPKQLYTSSFSTRNAKTKYFPVYRRGGGDKDAKYFTSLLSLYWNLIIARCLEATPRTSRNAAPLPEHTHCALENGTGDARGGEEIKERWSRNVCSGRRPRHLGEAATVPNRLFS